MSIPATDCTIIYLLLLAINAGALFVLSGIILFYVITMRKDSYAMASEIKTGIEALKAASTYNAMALENNTKLVEAMMHKLSGGYGRRGEDNTG